MSSVDMPELNKWILTMDLKRDSVGENNQSKMRNAFVMGSLCLVLAACSGGPSPKSSKGAFDPKYGVSASERVANKKGEFRKGGGHYKVGRPYKVAGRTYVPKDEPGYNKTGKASWYGDDFHGRLTANGEIFDMHTLTAAHPTLPLPSYARVTNRKNGRSVIVRINDRGPYAHNRIIDLSKRVAEVLDFKNDGITNVRVKYIGKARMDGQDARYLEASFRKKGERIGDDFRAVPKEGERRAPPTIMMASAKPTAEQNQAPKKSGNNYILAHVPALGAAPVTIAANTIAPSPNALTAAPTSGWAPVDLVGDGYFPPNGEGAIKKAPIQLASFSPLQLFYAKQPTQRVANGHAAITAMFDNGKQSKLKNALSSKLQPSRTIGSFENAYAMRLAVEFAQIAAVETIKLKDGRIRVQIERLKSGVQWSDIRALKRKFALPNG